VTAEEIQANNQQLIGAYQLTFNSPAGQIVLQDLMSFGKFRVAIDNQVDEGKRQAVLRIMNFSQLSLDQLTAAYRGRMTTKEET